MALWSNTDANTSAPLFAPAQVNLAPNATNRDLLYANTTADAFITGETVGVFGVDNNETVSRKDVTHAGWVLRTTGSGGRSGRVFQETLVAMGSVTGDGADDTPYPDAVITIVTQPQNASNTVGNTATFSVVATSVPTVALSYQWYGPVGLITGATNTTLTISNLEAANDATEYFVTVAATGAATVTSANAVLTVV